MMATSKYPSIQVNSGISERANPGMRTAASTPNGCHDATFELKFLVTEAHAARVGEWAARHLALDPHADPARDGAYRVTSLYLDTDGLDVFHQRGSYGRAKYRLRRYDAARSVFLERKCKVRGRVRKRRTRVESWEPALLSTAAAVPDWPGGWFCRRMKARSLRPTCAIAYQRVARVGSSFHGPIRLTLDREFLCRPVADLDLPVVLEGQALFEGQGVVELKYRVAMPALFKTLLRDLGLSPVPASKYRAGVLACGLCATEHSRESGDA